MNRRSIRRQAQNWREDILGIAVDVLIPVGDVLRRAADVTKIAFFDLPHGDPLLAGSQALLDRESGAIWLDASLDNGRRALAAAHEYAHLALHAPVRATDNAFDEIEIAEGYSPHQNREGDADIWAAELLMPEPMLRAAFFAQCLSSSQIALQLELSESTVIAQMRAVLLHPHDSTPSNSAQVSANSISLELDESQRRAATVSQGPFLLAAGPGTGKTRTLVARCQHLVQTVGIAAEKILALTFSRKAAAEMRERCIAAGIGSGDSGPWIGTFHAFCFETLMRYGERIGLPNGWRLAGAREASTLLETSLVRAQDLPSVPLPAILSAIARAKDELCSPEKYAELASAEVIETNARRLKEVAELYSYYQRVLHQARRLDYGDLIVKTVQLLQTDSDAQASLRQQYPQILADEYQDVNAASARLLRLLAGEDATGLWVVGDRRQSIYRFRGASPANIAQFERDYPHGASGALEINYRSTAPIVRLFESAAERLSAAEPQRFQGWHASRKPIDLLDRPVILANAESDDAQVYGMAQQARALDAAGIRYGDQAILCRTHTQALQVAEGLQHRGISILFTGNILERDDIKDILCFLDLFSSDGNFGSVIRLPAVTDLIRDVPFLMRWAKENGQEVGRPIRRLLASVDFCEREPDLAVWLGVLAREETPCALLDALLFGENGYLRRIYRDGEVSRGASASRLLALRRFYSLVMERQRVYERSVIAPDEAGAEFEPAIDAVTWFIRDLRISGLSGERVEGIPDDEDSTDAMRIMTIHASKGLEFRAVFIPNLSKGRFPVQDRGHAVPDPVGMASADDSLPQNEEAFLFFVALSRARDFLCLSRVTRRDAGSAILSPSPLLKLIEDGLAKAVRLNWPEFLDASDIRSAKDLAEVFLADTPGDTDRGALEMYDLCPRRYYYRYVWRFAERGIDTDYARYTQCVARALNWLDEETSQGRTPTGGQVDRHIRHLWPQVAGGRLHDALLLRQAVETVTQINFTRRARQAPEGKDRIRTGWTGRLVNFKNSMVRPSGDQKARNSLSAVVPGRAYRAKRAIEGISRRQFAARPLDARMCEACAYRFICPS